MIVIPLLLILVDFVVAAINHNIDIYGDVPNVAFWSSQDAVVYRGYHYFICVLAIPVLLFILILSMSLCLKCQLRGQGSVQKGKAFSLLIYICSGLIIMYVCYYALPTFLLLLVYPIKVIVVTAYFISHVFFTILFSSIYLRIAKVIKKCKILLVLEVTKGSKCWYTCQSFLFIMLLFVYIYMLLFFAFLFQFLCLLVLSRASYTTLGPYTIISLLPTAAISTISWMLRKRYFKIKHDENTGNSTADTNSTENNEDEVDENANNSTNDEENTNENTPENNGDDNTNNDSTGDAETTSQGEPASVEGDANSEEIPLIAMVNGEQTSSV